MDVLGSARQGKARMGTARLGVAWRGTARKLPGIVDRLGSIWNQNSDWVLKANLAAELIFCDPVDTQSFSEKIDSTNHSDAVNPSAEF